MMDKKVIKPADSKEFVMPTAEIIVFDTEDVITTSGGGFFGEWDDNLPEIDF